MVMKKLLQFALLLMLPGWLGAQTLTSIVLLPPTNGYNIPTSASTVQLTPQCFNGGSTITCPTLTWGSALPAYMTVNSSGLATVVAGGPASANITSWAISGNVLTIQAVNSFSNNQQVYIQNLSHGSYINNVELLITGSTGTAFTAGFTHANDSSTETGVARGANINPDIFAYAINSATITNCAIAAGVATLTASNTFVVGQNVAITASTHCPNLVGQPLTVATASGTQFTVSTGVANVASGSDTGTAETSVLGHAGVNVGSVNVTSLTFSFTAISTLVVNSPVLAAIHDNNNVGVTNFAAWTTSDATKATVNTLGEITGVGVGSVNITATYSGVSQSLPLTITNPTVTSNIYYYRSDGGTRYSAANTSGRCNGTANAADPGSGTNQNCAFNNPQYCWTDGVSTSGYTGAVQATDICQEGNAPPASPYIIFHQGNIGSEWSQPYNSPPSGVPGHPTKWRGFNYLSCTSDKDHIGNRSPMITLGGEFSNAINLPYVQNFESDCLDISTGNDCNQGIVAGYIDFACPGSGTPKNPFIVVVDDMTSNFVDNNSRWHGASNGVTGTPGPGMVLNGTSIQYGFLDGTNLDDPFGTPGVEADGIVLNSVDLSFNGCTEEQPKALSSVSRGSGVMNVTFGSAHVNYIVGNNFVLTGASPSDLNGTYPVSSITFNQQTATITGGTITFQPSHAGLGAYYIATVTTSSAVSFGSMDYIQITGATPSYVNGFYEVYSVSGSSFTFILNTFTNPGWTSPGSTISAGGTASTASSLVATAAGSTETASTVGTGGHVYQQHNCIDAGVGDGSGNGDGFGTGVATKGVMNFTGLTIRDNTQDGLDNLHSAITTSQVINVSSSGNMGAPIKFGNLDAGLIQNGNFIANAGKMAAPDPNKPPDFNQYLSLFWRAGDTIPTQVRMWSHVAIVNNSFTSSFGVLDDDVCDDADCTVLAPPLNYYHWDNNITYGASDSNIGVVAFPSFYCGFSCNGVGGVNANWTYLNNIGFQMKSGSTPGGSSNNWGLDPTLVNPLPNISSFVGESAALGINQNLLSGSPAIAFGVQNEFVPTTDFNGSAQTSPPVTGAFVFGGTPTVSTPTFSPGAGTYSGTQTVTISTTTGGASVIFTSNGSTPTVSSGCSITNGTLYTGPVTVATSLTLNAIGCESAFTPSGVGTAAYVITVPTVATPTFSPVAGTYGPTQTVTISTSTGGASLVYTTDGSTPTVTALTCTITHGTLYSGPLTVSTSQTIKAIGCLASDNASSVGTAAYIINGAASTPTFSPVAGSYGSAQTVTLSTATSGCGSFIVWNTTNAQSGGNLTGTSSTNPLTVSSSETVYAQVQGCPTYVNSSIGSAAYTITIAPTTLHINGAIKLGGSIGQIQ